jgi:hypothetical protein
MKTPRNIIFATLLFIAPAQAHAAGTVDLALVLAVDASSGVSYVEFNLQMSGLADAFRDKSVQAAIALATPNGMAVTMVQWSSIGEQRQAFPWTVLREPDDAEALAEVIGRTPRLNHGGGTAISDAIDFSVGLIQGSRVTATRRVIDISGDGRTNMGLERGPETSRRAVAAGIIINGLAILNDDPLLEAYYLTHVIGGTNAFTMVADDYSDFAAAIRIKLITEITGAPMF